MIRIAASASPGEIRLAVIDGGTLEDYALWRPGAPDGLGDVHWGRITARVPAMAGAFVALAGQSDGFLPDSDGAAGRTEGDMLAVRITRTAQGGKGPRLASADSAQPSLSSASLPSAGLSPASLHQPGLPPAAAQQTSPDPGSASSPHLLHAGPSPLARLAALYPSAAIQIDDAALFARLRPDFPTRLSLVRQAFDDDLETAAEALSSTGVALPGGLFATIIPTPALTAIDVDGGASTAARGQKSIVQFAANRAAMPALIRQIRLRNLSGAILLDLAGVSPRRRPALAPDIAAGLARDPARPRLLGFTQLGFAEILRPRLAAPLHEMLAGPHAAGLAALRLRAAEPGRHAALRAGPAVVAALQADTQALADLARRSAYPLILRSDPALPPHTWVIEDAP